MQYPDAGSGSASDEIDEAAASHREFISLSGVHANLAFPPTIKGDDMADNEQLVTDPVCQMKIKPSEAVATIEHAGTVYHFCSQDCADSFKESPEDYL
jgi:YHS domain-containing protein